MSDNNMLGATHEPLRFPLTDCVNKSIKIKDVHLFTLADSPDAAVKPQLSSSIYPPRLSCCLLFIAHNTHSPPLKSRKKAPTQLHLINISRLTLIYLAYLLKLEKQKSFVGSFDIFNPDFLALPVCVF